MDKIWQKILRSRRSLAVVVGMKKTNNHAEPTKVERLTKKKQKKLVFLKDLCQDLFLLHINDLPLSLTNSTADIFEDDSTPSAYNYNVADLLDSLSDDLVNVNTWYSKN